MGIKLKRPLAVASVVAVGLIVAALVAGATTNHFAAAKPAKLRLELDKMGAHNHQLAAVKHSPWGSPVLATAQEIGQRAYPATSLPSRLQDNARGFFQGNIESRGNDDNGRSWQLAGPSTATFPALLTSTGSDYVTSGRVTAVAISPSCTASACRLWAAAAGGGIWRTDNALSPSPTWASVSGSFASNAIGALTYDATSNTLYAGTGEPNASGDSEAGIGIYKSTDGGSNWSLLRGSPAATNARSISSIVVDPAHPNTLYVGTARGVRGVSSVTGGAVSRAPDAPAFGLYRTQDGGDTFSLVWDGAGTGRGVNHVELDSHGTVYAAAFGKGIWRSANGATGWERIFAAQDVGNPDARTEFALAQQTDTHTRIYVGDGGSEDPDPNATAPDGVGYASNTGVYRADGIDTATAASLVTDGSTGGYTSLTSQDPASPQYATYDYCSAQCWYDNFVVSPAGHPDVVYVGGSYDYTFQSYGINYGRGVLLSTTAGDTWSDQSGDASSPQNGMHPDQHALVVSPSNPKLFFEGSDGGVIRSSGSTTDTSANCPIFGSPYDEMCQNVTTAVPTLLTAMNVGLSTLQFQSVAVNPTDSKDLIGGTQDNGTWVGKAGNPSWSESIWGDGGQAGFDIASKNFRFTNFYSPYTDVNFRGGDPTAWVFVGDPWFDTHGVPQENSAFYLPEINDPATSGTLFIGLQHVWRTTDFGGNQAYLESHCKEFDAYKYDKTCGDWKPLGDPSEQGSTGYYTQDTPSYSAGDLTAPGVYGTDRAGGYLAAIARSATDKATLWAATTTGRVFVSLNANAPRAGDVAFSRIDGLSAAAPNRFVSGIVLDPKNANHAWVSYSGYNANTPDQPGHVFEVTYDPKKGKATWTNIDRGTGPLGDLPVTGIALDTVTGQLYASTDFGVLTQRGNSGSWRLAAPGMPVVEVAGLTIDSAHRVLYASTHGRAIWSLQLSGDSSGDHGGNGGGNSGNAGSSGNGGGSNGGGKRR
jgi:hypothetical protein